MTLVQKMRSQLAPAMKAKDAPRLAFLRYWIAQLTLGSGEEMKDEDALKKMRGVLKEARSGVTTFTPEELELLKEWVPVSLTPDRIREALAPAVDQIRAAAKDGIALGVAMKALAGKPVETEDVKAAVAALRAQA